MKIGDSYVCSTDIGKVIGFVLINKNKSNALRFAVVRFKNNEVTSMDDFKKGKLFTHNVCIGIKGDYKMGIQTYDVYYKDFIFLNKLKHLGQVSINESKFTNGGGTIYTNELFFNLHFNSLELSNANYKTESIMEILQ